MITIARGQPIEILTSSATDRMHPIAGDKGFISNAYLCPNQKFIVCDIYFFRYGNETRTRCERKLFIIDLGMDKSIKYQLTTKYTRSNFQVMSENHVNLTATFLYLTSGTRFTYLKATPEMYGNTSLFRSSIRRSAVRSMEAKIKIPFGTVKCPVIPKELADSNMVLALFKAVRPVLNDILAIIPSVLLNLHYNRLFDDVTKLLGNNFRVASVPDYLSPIRSLVYNPVEGMSAEKLVEYIRKTQSIAAVVSRKSTNTILTEIMRRYKEAEATVHPSMAWAIWGLNGWFNEKSNSVGENIHFVENKLAYLIYRALFSSRTVDELTDLFTRIQTNECTMPLLSKDFLARAAANKVMSLRTACVNDSAALNRFFERDFFR